MADQSLVRIDKATHERLKELAKPQSVASYLREISEEKETISERMENIEQGISAIYNHANRQIALLTGGISLVVSFIDGNIAPGFMEFYRKNLTDVADQVEKMREEGVEFTNIELKHKLYASEKKGR